MSDFTKEDEELAEILLKGYLRGHWPRAYAEDPEFYKETPLNRGDCHIGYWRNVAKGLRLNGANLPFSKPSEPIRPIFGKIETDPSDIWIITRELGESS